jgi:hypothetical protein
MPDDHPNPDQKPRRRGAQPGNFNAVKHGFYARQFLTSDIQDLKKYKFEGLSEEIKLMRVYIRRVAESFSPDSTPAESLELLRIMTFATLCLTRLVRTQHLICPEDDTFASSIQKALNEVRAELLPPSEWPAAKP